MKGSSNGEQNLLPCSYGHLVLRRTWKIVNLPFNVTRIPCFRFSGRNLPFFLSFYVFFCPFFIMKLEMKQKAWNLSPQDQRVDDVNRVSSDGIKHRQDVCLFHVFLFETVTRNRHRKSCHYKLRKKCKEVKKRIKIPPWITDLSDTLSQTVRVSFDRAVLSLHSVQYDSTNIKKDTIIWTAAVPIKH